MNLRSLVAEVMVSVIHDRKSLDPTLDDLWIKVPEPKDRAFIQAMSYGVLRHFEPLSTLLSYLTRKPIRDPKIHCLALLGLYQLGHTRVPAHAAVSETVSAAMPEIWAKPLLNGILRNYERNRLKIDQALPKTPESVYGHPQWLIDRITSDWPDHFAEILAANHEHPPLTLRVNSLRQSRKTCLELLSQHHITAREGRLSPDALVLDHAVPVESLPGFLEGDLSIQDEAAQMAAHLLDAQAGMRVLDLCAAPGGKTCHILERCQEIGALVAIDIDPTRLDRIRSNLKRLNLSASLQSGDALKPSAWWDGAPFDRILLDAPCSATGVIRRHPDIKLHRKPTDIASLANTQLRLLETAWPLLKVGGMLLYATCSILRQENTEVAERFLERTPNAKEVVILEAFGVKEKHGRQILTGTHGMDGFYYAKFQKIRE